METRRAIVLGGAAAGFVIVVLALLLALTVARGPQLGSPVAGGLSTAPYTIVAEGNGEASAPPDVGYVTIGVQTPAPTAAEATDANAQAMAGVIAAIKAQGVADKDVQTQGFSVTPVYATQRPGDSSPPTITGYRVSNTVRVTVENVGNVGKVLDAGLRARANSAVGVSFALKDSTSLQQQALKDAVSQAKAKAEAIAAGAGLKLTGTYSITESGATPPRPFVTAQPAASAAATPIETGQLTVTGHVQVAFQYAH